VDNVKLIYVKSGGFQWTGILWSSISSSIKQENALRNFSLVSALLFVKKLDLISSSTTFFGYYGPVGKWEIF
jgi:hypothetical protein